MVLPDEISLKAEIKKISDKIDIIINTVNQFHPLKQESESSETDDSDQIVK